MLFDSVSTQLPEAPLGEILTEHSGNEMKVTLHGPPALELRRWLTQFPVNRRAQEVAQRFAGEGAKLMSHDGLVEFGQTIRLRIETQSRR